MKAVLLVSHGSHSPETKKEVGQLVRQLMSRNVADIVADAYLEIETPSISDGIETCVRQGVQEIVILLNFLNSGRHVDQDIPAIIKRAQKKYPDVKFSITKPLGHHPRIVELFINLLSKSGTRD